ncbi:hypothetical protein EVJ50_13425 [Synechococcus sp. RSCCF101]|uniref:hypothetical protein n=1 Tax=Synechococcus sp. RSCCF101 TaxID=2511069 RepID=UPI00124535B4|nr:hypothetical protein [Synechococcus sp. RSCCF101]QEY33083.1 hypothetical protein EVJ50_13425 [Synechococcus sp. RSCCF101]
MVSAASANRQRCSLCKVEIEALPGGREQVLFSQGEPGSRAKLWARVCQYLRTPEQCAQCINQDPGRRGAVQETDYYAEAPRLDLPQQ